MNISSGFQRVAAAVLLFAGLIGLAYGFVIHPGDYQIISDTAQWVFVTLVSSTVFFVGWAGLRRNKLTAYHLKVIDLVWVTASAIAVAFAAIQATQISADAYRTVIKHNIEQSRSVARSMLRQAYSDECLVHQRLGTAQCSSLRTLGIVVEGDGYLSPSIVGAVCPRTIQLDAPPANFGPALIEGCISAGYAAYAAEDPVLVDESNASRWKTFTGLWPLFLILLISLRVTKSAAEVFWGIK
ncbi:hypothetical protein [Uliginosibacterium gangwonense]|uniref:hypothetical protein n=1 Tax=Uliginosibacterium gangwonense TaxID=392736 RepID=UPI00036CD24E|nr:hypothetical protein [Uliginosibacterium gangwonense]